MSFRKTVFRSRRSPARLSAAVLLMAGLLATPAAAEQPFGDWLAGLRAEALRKGVSAATFDNALKGVSPVAEVIEKDRAQPEFTMTFDAYMARVVTPARIETARQKLVEHRDLLARISARYGVAPRFIVALWGIESNFGTRAGSYPVIGALATLAYDGRRSAYFRQELLAALRVLQAGHITADRMTGSWAGAMGQSQFMPSSYLRFAADGDGDGRDDIWTNTADVFASAANYLAKSGWKGDQTWGRPVRLPGGFDAGLASPRIRKTLRQWERLGVRAEDGGPLPTRNLSASVVLPAGVSGPAFVAYENFRVIRRWNPSDFFVLAVGRLADAAVAQY
jgi:membrane-bound lytic murein transglycosylase B